MTDAIANEMLGLIESKENELNEARHQLSIYTDLVTRLEREVETLNQVTKILIDSGDRVESEHNAKDSLKENVSDFYGLLQWFKGVNALTDAQIGKRIGVSGVSVMNYRKGITLPRGKIKRALKAYMNEVGGISEDEFDSYYYYSLSKE